MSTKLLKYDWKFCKCDSDGAHLCEFDDQNWRTVRVPHDYAIEGPFHPDNDKQVECVEADGITKPIVHVARTGGLPICDGAWYRKKVFVSTGAKRVFVEFDGVMSNSTVYFNGVECGGRPYGYSSFSVEVTDSCVFGEDNLLAVRLKPEGSASRWYTGAGIYRNVRLVEKKSAFFPYNPTYIRSDIDANNAVVTTSLSVESAAVSYTVRYNFTDPVGNVVHSSEYTSHEKEVTFDTPIENFMKWHIGEGSLYSFTAELYIDAEQQDSYSVNFGIRKIEFNSEKGFFLNGENIKLNGVCQHHDVGAIGAAVNVSAYRRQLLKLSEMGVNAVRCTHNPPAPEFLDLCDELGILAIDEAFDMWEIHKTENDYAKHFKAWAERDLTDMIFRDRNHPCVIMWSLGNEILEQEHEDGWRVTKYLNDICHKVDSSRPTTCGFNSPVAAFNNHLCDHVDIVGVNYKPHLYEQFHRDYPNAILYGSETSSCISSRGEYFLDAEISIPAKKRDNLQINSYDLDAPPWAYYPEREFFAQDKYDFIFGEFVWTGFDYLGEPTPYRDEWPSRSSYFGIFDLAGIEKDRYYSYKSRWTEKSVLHIFPHWNWKPGDIVDVHCYSSYPSVELFLNGKSLGVCSKNAEDEIASHRLIWKAVPFEAGELKAVAVGNPDTVCIVRTAGEPDRLLLEPERTTITADGDDLVYIRCTAVDKDANVCPSANLKIDFTVKGAGEYIAADNGDATDTRVFAEQYCKLYNGKCMTIIRSVKGVKGEINISANTLGIPMANCSVMAE